MKSTGGIALLLLAIAVVTGAGGGLLIRHAVMMPAPDPTRPPELAGVVVQVAAGRCSQRRNAGTCFRPIVRYTQDGVVKDVGSRTRYSPSSPHKVGERVPVLIEPDGSVWIASEWENRLADRQRDYASARRFPFLMGVMIVVCAAFALILAVGVAFAQDREATAGPESPPAA